MCKTNIKETKDMDLKKSKLEYMKRANGEKQKDNMI